MISALVRSPALWLTGVLLLLSLPLLVLREIPNYSSDEANFHLPAVRQIAGHWPRLDVTADSLSATAPGYHYALATLGQITGTRLRTMRAINFLVSAAVLGLLALVWQRRGGAPALAIAAILPLAASNFFVKSASCLVTDNAALLCVAGGLSAVFFCSAPTPASFGFWAVGATAVRQSNVWLSGLGAVAAIAALGPVRRRLFLGVAALAPLAALGLLWSQWHGPVPPAWREPHLARPNASMLAPLVYLLALAALLAPAYFMAAGERLRGRDSRWIGGASALGFLLALVGPTNFDHDAGRWGGYLWEASRHLPHFGRRSLFFLVLCPLGSVAIVSLARALWQRNLPRAAILWITGLVCWASTLIVNQQAFHRYYEPTLLLFLISWLLLMQSPRPAAPTRGLWLLGGAQIVLTVATAHARAYGVL